MGAKLSLTNHKTSFGQVPRSEACKRQRTSYGFWDKNLRLIPILPDEVSLQILARIPRISHLKAKQVSRSWKAALTSAEYYNVRKELGTTEEWLYVLTKLDDEKLVWHALDPVSCLWQRLPSMPYCPSEGRVRRGLSGFRFWNILGSSTIAVAIRGFLGMRESLDEIPFCGCAIGAVDGCLYVMGGFSRASTMKSVWRYDPIVNAWSEVSSMSIGRAYCKTGVLNNKLYVVGGLTRGQGGLNPLQSAEVFDPCSDTWSDVPSMPFTKEQVLPIALLADILKPIATGMTSYRGKLYVPQSLYCWPFFVDVGGEIYDPDTNSWAEMPDGMGDGWPAKQAGTKLSATVNGDLYALDSSGSLDSARIKVYDDQEDSWKTMDGNMPICDSTDSDSPYLLASFLGKLHVVTKDANHNISVMEADWKNRLALGPSTSSADVSASSGNIWKVVAARNVGSAELISCQVLDI